ncbi:hypothetical protein CDAR_506461 [Caerostris darwini]|uniref:Uncharacterized protein n=1 Tax=Caerostris darwini TaxID=1538125 RepID=A0AAV4QEI0_9ARAC|nr:hypothetical protein CDAR_506461 [Caerostris darwini]
MECKEDKKETASPKMLTRSSVLNSMDRNVEKARQSSLVNLSKSTKAVRFFPDFVDSSESASSKDVPETDSNASPQEAVMADSSASSQEAATTHSSVSSQEAATTHSSASSQEAATTHSSASSQEAATTHSSASSQEAATTHSSTLSQEAATTRRCIFPWRELLEQVNTWVEINRSKDINYTDVVEPFIRFVGISARDPLYENSSLPFVDLVPKALLGIYVIPKVFPDSQVYFLNTVISYFYFYCTTNIWGSFLGFILTSVCVFFMYEGPQTTIKYINSPILGMVIAFCGTVEACEFTMDIILMVTMAFAIYQKCGTNIFALSFISMSFYYPALRKAYREAKLMDNTEMSGLEKTAEM